MAVRIELLIYPDLSFITHLAFLPIGTWAYALYGFELLSEVAMVIEACVVGDEGDRLRSFQKKSCSGIYAHHVDVFHWGGFEILSKTAFQLAYGKVTELC